MAKINKKTILCILLSAFCILFFALFFFSKFQGWVYVDDNGLVHCSKTPSTKSKSEYVPSENIDDMEISDVSDVSISFLGKSLPKDSKIYERSDRYYISLKDVCSLLDCPMSTDGTSINISENASIDTENFTATKNGMTYELRGKLISKPDSYYIGLSDIENIFGLSTNFDFEKRTINFVHNPIIYDLSDTLKPGHAALIRLEDVSASPGFLDAANQEKFKIMADFLGSHSIRYHVAWAPRFKSPEDGIDNDLITNKTIEYVGFVDMLDKVILSGGEIGLHGYTHQYGNEVSLSGIELSKTANPSEEETKKVVEQGLNTASKLNIPVTFFESPHYKATSKQLSVIGRYFQYVYQPYNIINYTTLALNKGSLYIPTPLGYVRNGSAKNIIRGLNHPLPYQLASLYYHPTIELKYIDFNFSDSDMTYTYDTSSPLQEITKAIIDNGYTTINVSDIK